jgi:calpain-10
LSYQIKLFKDGQWQIVTIDDRIPMYGNSPIYGKCKDINELWVPLIEKAYAKLHKCYEALNSGSIAAALTDLTGEGSQSLYVIYQRLSKCSALSTSLMYALW